MSKQKRSAKPSALYEHKARNMVARQLNISRSDTETGHSSYTDSSSQFRLKPLTPVHTQAEHELCGAGCPTDAGMDIDGDHVANPGADQPVEVMPGIHATTKPKGPCHENENSDDPLNTWFDYQDDYLDACMTLEGRGSLHDLCAGCRAPKPIYRCEECTLGIFWCQLCMLKRHNQMPLHFVEMWNGTFFQRTTLRDLGLRVQLGHALGDPCPTLLAANVTFRVIHLNGIHQVAVDQCRCQGAVEFYRQLLRIGWWPATQLNPKTVATMEVLRHFHLLNLHGKVTGSNFYQALEYQTDNTGLNPSGRLNTFMLMVREWRDIQGDLESKIESLKRAAPG